MNDDGVHMSQLSIMELQVLSCLERFLIKQDV